jgi:glycosyltransferase involved in cell wall biosynthesis
MKVLILSYSDIIGGASRAANRLHNALIENNNKSRMRVRVKKTDLVTVDSTQGKISKVSGKLRFILADQLMRLQKSPNPILHSPAVLPSGLVNEINNSDADVLNLHWINNEFLSIEDVGHLSIPLVLTLHDMWAFCGSEHYAPDDINARWRIGYTSDTRPEGHSGLDIDRWVWKRKLNAWTTPMHIVTPSYWLADCVKNCVLMQGWPVTVIPNPLDTQQYQPWPKAMARALLGLPLTPRLVLFGAIGGGKDPRKGWDLLQSALMQVANNSSDIQCVIFGQSEPDNAPKLGLPLHWLGHLNDDVTLSILYSAVDVTVVPSRQENLPQTATEAQACGCPVVAFNTTGLKDVVEHEKTGYLAKAFSIKDLAEGIMWILADKDRHVKLSTQARQRAVRLWSYEVVIPQYLDVYGRAIEEAKQTKITTL